MPFVSFGADHELKISNVLPNIFMNKGNFFQINSFTQVLKV